MEPGSSKEDKFRSFNGLVCLVQSIKGHNTTVDLRDGSSVTGTLEQTDSHMNIIMRNALFRDGSGQPYVFDMFFVHSRNIRYVHIPTEVDMTKSIVNFFEKSSGRRNQPVKKVGFKQKELERKQAETLQMVHEMKVKIKKE